ncbi:MAG: hypothetical protein J1E40_05945 [Oscillospiraceae bacterium]|nr:hypothetical protein [Oscillospiraceae bacterium]
MKRSCIPLLVMSVISLMISAYAAIDYIHSINTISQLNAIDRTIENSIALDLAQVAVEVSLFFDTVVFAAALILGLCGLIGILKKGRLSILCIILDSIPLAYIFFGVIDFLIKRSDLYKDYMFVLLYLALYMTGAVIAFRGRKKLQK